MMTPGTLVELPDGTRGYYQGQFAGRAKVLVEVLIPVKELKKVK